MVCRDEVWLLHELDTSLPWRCGDERHLRPLRHLLRPPVVRARRRGPIEGLGPAGGVAVAGSDRRVERHRLRHALLLLLLLLVYANGLLSESSRWPERLAVAALLNRQLLLRLSRIGLPPHGLLLARLRRQSHF